MLAVALSFDTGLSGAAELLTRFGGSAVQGEGSGALALFTSPLEAARAALAIQDAHRQARFGLEVGEVVVSEGEATGPAASVAESLRMRANPGCIVFSPSAYESVKGKLEFEAEPLSGPDGVATGFTVAPGSPAAIQTAIQPEVEAPGSNKLALLAVAVIVLGLVGFGIVSSMNRTTPEEAPPASGAKGDQESPAVEAGEDPVAALIAANPTLRAKQVELKATYRFGELSRWIFDQPFALEDAALDLIERYQELDAWRIWVEGELPKYTETDPLSVEGHSGLAQAWRASDGRIAYRVNASDPPTSQPFDQLGPAILAEIATLLSAKSADSAREEQTALFKAEYGLE